MNNENYLFLSHLIPGELYEEVQRNSTGNMQEAANALQWHIIEGLSRHIAEFDTINLLAIASFPQYYKKAFVKKTYFKTNSSTKNINIGFCNVKLVRNKFIVFNLYRALLKWCKSHSGEKTIIVYTLNNSMLSALNSVKKKFKDIKVCAIVADLPDMASLTSKKSFLRRLAEKNSAKSSYSNISCVDCFVLLTKYMAEYLNTDKPFCVMEGIATKTEEKTDYKEKADNGIKTILYTGTLHRRFGILHLLEAFSMIADENYRLVICGIGDSEEEIKRAAEKDSRINYMGQVPRKEILDLQKQATVLINPRMNNEEFTRYSFPSKNLEYLSSGTPLIAYKLDGIPDEYDDYIIYVNDNEASTLAKMIEEVCSLPAEELNRRGNRAYEFVMKEKNSVIQAKKIIDLLSNTK